MKKLAIAMVMLGILGFLSFPASAGSPEAYDSVVVGKSDSTYDVKAVQDAVYKGGAVLLKGNFDFGDEGRVKITRCIKIYGEKDKQGIPLTRIKGGFWTFHSPLPAQLPPQIPGPKITIQDIHFDGALWSPICVTYSRGATIAGNRITNVRPKLSVPLFGRKDISRQQGIVFSPLYALYGLPKEKRKYQPGAITGSIMVTDNDIDLTCEEPEKTMAQGVFAVWTTGADIRMLRNRVVNCSRNSLESLDNYPGEDGSGTTLIKGNKIITGRKGVPVPSPSTPNGVVAGWFLDLSGASDLARRTKIVVLNNQIEVNGDTSFGIAVISDGGIISSNHIVVGGGPKAKGILQVASNSLITNNRIEGSGLAAAIVMPFKSLKGSGNTFVGNDFSLFKASTAGVLLQSSDNILIGKCGRVVDKGQRNLASD